jgi:hypothetical protein
MANCTKCGSVLKSGTLFCNSCGAPVRPASQTTVAAGSPATQAASGNPKSTSTSSQFGRYILKRLPLMALTFAGSALLHTYLVYLNNGFDPGKVTEYTPYINVDENPGSSAFLIWTALSGLGWSFLSTIFSQGPIRAVTSIVMQPVNMVKKLFTSTHAEYACWAVGGGGALVATAMLGANRPAGFSMALLWSFLGLSQFGQMLAQLIYGGLTQILSGHVGRLRPSVELIQIVIAALAPGFALAGALGTAQWQLVAGLAAIAGGVFLFLRKKPGGMANAAGQVTTLFLVAFSGAAIYSLFRLLWPRSAYANDFGKAENGSFINAITKGGINGVTGVVLRSLWPAGGAAVAPLLPPIKLPDPPGNKGPNVFDPPPDEQQRMWNKNHVIWDPSTLSYRPPKPNEYPPPVDPPEKTTPFQQQVPRDQVPPDCLDLYDAYVRSQGIVLSGDDQIQAASQAYQQAMAHLLELFAKLEMYLGIEAGEMIEGARGAIKGAGGLVESGSGVKQATRAGLRDIADRAAVEAAAAESEVASQTALMNNLRQVSLDATGELTTATQSLNTLKSGLTDVTSAQGEVDTASTALNDAETAVTESEENLEVARNQQAAAKTNLARAKEWAALDSETTQMQAQIDQMQNEEYAIAKEYNQAHNAEIKAKVDARMDKLLQDQVDLSAKLNQLKAQSNQIEKQVGHTLRIGENAEYDALKDQINAVKAQKEVLDAKKGPLGFREALEEEAASEPLAPEVQEIYDRHQLKESAKNELIKQRDQKLAAQNRLMNQIDPSYDNDAAFAQTEQNLEKAQEANLAARQNRDLAKGKLADAKQKLTQAQQQSADLQQQIAQKQGNVDQLNQKVNSLAQQESDSGTKLDQLKDAAKQKRDEANRLGHAALDSANDPNAPATDTSGSAPGAGSSVSVNPQQTPLIRRHPTDQSYDPFAGSVDKYKPDWAYWVEEKLKGGGEAVGDFMKRNFGVESSAEVAQLVVNARQEVDDRKAELDRLTNEYNRALGVMADDAATKKAGLKSQLDACIQQHTYWQGDGSVQ